MVFQWLGKTWGEMRAQMNKTKQLNENHEPIERNTQDFTAALLQAWPNHGVAQGPGGSAGKFGLLKKCCWLRTPPKGVRWK